MLAAVTYFSPLIPKQHLCIVLHQARRINIIARICRITAQKKYKTILSCEEEISLRHCFSSAAYEKIGLIRCFFKVLLHAASFAFQNLICLGSGCSDIQTLSITNDEINQKKRELTTKHCQTILKNYSRMT